MATAKLIANLEKICTCPICQSGFTDPKALPCLHAFCTECLQGHIHATAVKRHRGFKCPLCREFTPVPKPGKAKSRWAEQFAKDFVVADIQSNVKEHESAEQKENVTTSPTEHSPPLLNTNPLQPNTHPLHQTNSQHVVRDTETFEGRQIFKPSDSRSVLKLTGELVNTVSIADESSKMPYACDFVVLEQNGVLILATLDFDNHKLLTLNLDSEMKVRARSSRDLGVKPWRICKVKENEVAVTVSQPNGIFICTISNDAINVVRRIPTTKNYDGIAVPFGGFEFVTTTKDNVDILREGGSVRCEHVVKSPNTKYTYNSYVIVTSDDNIVVTDSEGKALSCMTQDGKIKWQKRGNFSGVTSTPDGVIFVSEAEGAVYQYSPRGRKLCKVAETKHPSGIFADDNGHLFVISDYKNVNVYKLIPSTA